MKFNQKSSGNYTCVFDVTEYEAQNVAQFVDEVLREEPEGFGKFILDTPKGVIIPEFTYYKGDCDSTPARKRVYVNVNGKMMWGEAPLHLNRLKIVGIEAIETEYRRDVDYRIKCVEVRHDNAAPNFRRVDEPLDKQGRCFSCLHCYMDFDSRKHACSKYDETFVNPHRWTCDDWERDL